MQLFQARRVVQAIDLDELFPSGGAVHDADRPAWNLEGFGEQIHQRRVRRSLDGRRVYLHLEGVAVTPDDTGLCGPRL